MDMDYVITDIANPEVVLREATEWLSQFYKEKKLSDSQYPKYYIILYYSRSRLPLSLSIYKLACLCFDYV